MNRLLATIVFLVGSHLAVADPVPHSAPISDDDWIEHEGEIFSIDYGERTAIIDGYRFYFGTVFEPAEVSTFDFPQGAFELLKPGMKVQFHFVALERPYRILRLRQLPDDAWSND